MDITDLNIVGIGADIKALKPGSDDQKMIEAAKGFESVLIQKMLDTVKESMVDWDDSEDGASDQIQGIFWMQLGEEISNQGGFGLWEDIYKSMKNGVGNNEETSVLPDIKI